MPEADPLLQIDPFVVLMDARQQLLAAVEGLAGAEPERVATAIGAVVAYEDALRDIATAAAEGDRTFEGVASPVDRAQPARLEDAHLSRRRLVDTLADTQTTFDVEVRLPWAGTATWHVHLIGLAMFEGAQAHALREHEPVPAHLDR